MLRCVFFSARVKLEDGTGMKSRKATHLLNQDIVQYSFDYCEEYPEALCLTVKTNPSKYTHAIRWIRRLLWSSTYSSSTLKRQVSRMKRKASSTLHSSSKMRSDVMIRELRTSDYSMKSSYVHQQLEWIPRFERELKKDPERVIKTFNSLKSICMCLRLAFHKPSDKPFSNQTVKSSLHSIRECSWPHSTKIKLVGELYGTTGK